MTRLNKIFDKILFISTAISSIAFFLIIIISVLSRYIFKQPILASIELSRLLFVWSCFLAAAITYRKKSHVGFELLFSKLSVLWQKYVTLFIHVIIITFLVTVFVQSIIVIKLLWLTDLPMMHISQAWFYVPVPLVCFFMVSFAVEFLIKEFVAKI